MSKNISPKVQGGEVTYELHSLGWKAFQNLCVTVMSEIWGQVVQSFFDSHDGGRDGAFSGTWMPAAGESFQGAFTAQCKFTAKADRCLQFSDLKDEYEKAKEGLQNPRRGTIGRALRTSGDDGPDEADEPCRRI